MPFASTRIGARDARRRGSAVPSLLLAAVLASLGAPAPAPAQPLRFVALGDQPYGDDARVGPAYRHLIELINAERVPLAIHVGDFKHGFADCSDAGYARQAEHFQRFQTALVYTPGDNDWSDCARLHADPLERLAALRQRFFAAPRSLGQRPIAVERQPDTMPEHARYRENLRWSIGGIAFVTLNTVGPDDNVGGPPALRAEQRAREAADIAWLRAAFAQASERGARALVVATQADVLRPPKRRLTAPPVIHRAFRPLFEQTLLPLARASTLPVLLVHGDSHRFVADRPFRDAAGPIANLWRLQVPGDMRMHAVLVTVDADRHEPFDFRLIWNALAPDPDPGVR